MLVLTRAYATLATDDGIRSLACRQSAGEVRGSLKSKEVQAHTRV